MAEKYSITKAYEHYADHPVAPSPGWQSVPCVVHDESRPSASLNETLGKFHCFSCGFHGDALDLIKAKEGIESFADAQQRAAEITGGTVLDLSGATQQPPRGRPVLLLDGDPRAERRHDRTVQARRRRKPRRI